MPDGEPHDFKTHSNEFLVKREDTLATEAFLVRVAGRGCVPPHVHDDMEQTFVFVSGVGRVRLWRENETRELRCRPGDVAFIPTGWTHTSISDSAEGLAYLSVNAFVTQTSRDVDTACGGSGRVLEGFERRATAPCLPTVPGTVDLHRAVETTYAVEAGRLRAQNYTAFDATLERCPRTYRVRHTGPFEYVLDSAEETTAVNSEVLADLAAVEMGALPVLIEGSQSPLSLKSPTRESDLDLLVAVGEPGDLEVARRVRAELEFLQDRVDAPVSVGIVYQSWLRLPQFYSAVHVALDSPDRRWWSATRDERQTEARRRIEAGLELLSDTAAVLALRDETLSVFETGVNLDNVTEWRITPRWLGLK